MLPIKSGRLSKPVKAVIYGLEGTGKSTLAAHTPSPLFLDTEGGTTYLDVNRIDQFTGWEGLLNTIEEVARDTSCCSTLVIDTADWAEQMAIKHICEKYKQTGLESFGFGKGYTYLAEEFARLLRACENVLASGRNVVIVAHARVRKQELPEEMGAFGQGFRDMSAPTKELMRLVLERKIIHGGHPVLRWNMDNVFVRTDPAGNIKIDKEKSTEKVDGAVALVMGLDRAMKNLNGGDSVYNHRGLIIL